MTNNVVNVPLSGATGTGSFVGSASPTASNVTVDNLNLSGNTLSSTDTNGNMNFSPNGSGGIIQSTSATPPIPFSAGLDYAIASNRAGGTGFCASSFTSGPNICGTLIFTKSRNTTIGNHTPVISGDALGGFFCAGDDGTNFTPNGAQIIARVDGAVSTNIVPTRWELRTSNSSGNNVLAVTINSSQVSSFVNPIVTPSIVTSPAASSSSTLAIGTAYQNTLGYDVVLTVYLAVTAAVAGTILLGVGPTNTPTQQTIVSGLNLVAAFIVVPVTIYLPAGYYALLSTGGTSVAQTISGQQAMPV